MNEFWLGFCAGSTIVFATCAVTLWWEFRHPLDAPMERYEFATPKGIIVINTTAGEEFALLEAMKFVEKFEEEKRTQ
jgi:hypothetical protein